MKKVLLISLIILSVFGIFFIGVATHELYHVITMKGADSICFPTNLKINDSIQNGYLIAYTGFDMSKYDNVEEFNSLREYSEKYAGIIGNIASILVALVIGFLIGRSKE